MIERALERFSGNRKKAAEASEDQHRDALAKDEAVRHFILKVFVSLRNAR